MHTNDSEVSQKRYKYNGKERDDETGLDYYGARYYASWLCRFVSVDPLKDNYPMQNSFAYADNNPVTLMDINGEGTDDGGDEEAPKDHPSEWKFAEGKAQEYYPGRNDLQIFESNGVEILKQDTSVDGDLNSFDYFYRNSENEWVDFLPNSEFFGLADEVTAVLSHPVKAIINNTEFDATYTLEAGGGTASYTRLFGVQLEQGKKVTFASKVLEVKGLKAFNSYFIEQDSTSKEGVKFFDSYIQAKAKHSKGIYAGSASFSAGIKGGQFNTSLEAGGAYSVFSTSVGVSTHTNMMSGETTMKPKDVKLSIELLDTTKEGPRFKNGMKSFHSLKIDITFDLLKMWNDTWNKPVKMR